jgi:hypothetical protein
VTATFDLKLIVVPFATSIHFDDPVGLQRP